MKWFGPYIDCLFFVSRKDGEVGEIESSRQQGLNRQGSLFSDKGAKTDKRRFFAGWPRPMSKDWRIPEVDWSHS